MSRARENAGWMIVLQNYSEKKNVEYKIDRFIFLLHFIGSRLDCTRVICGKRRDIIIMYIVFFADFYYTNYSDPVVEDTSR